MGEVNSDILIDAWRRLLVNPNASWVLFEHGTCVVLTAPEGDLAEQAEEILRRVGPVHVGSSAGDFTVINPEDAEGWAVTSHHPDVLTYVAADEIEEHTDIAVGLYGRSKRHRDGTELRVVHVEDKRDEAPPA
ncbi:hypothetical protein [Streptomyces sp. NPDC020917]|uniref:hypothetical protein n=1 Tax=Streptomyces sp. NPDC020917 TaxID=3365102 RepID=UPI0037A08F7D